MGGTHIQRRIRTHRLGAVALASAAALALAACTGGGAPAPDTSGDGQAGIPTGTIRLLVPFAPGGAADVASRVLAGAFEEALGQSVVVENLPDGSGSAAFIEMLAQPADEATVLMATGGAGVVTPILTDVGFTMDQYTAVGSFTETGYVLITPPDSPYATAEEFFEAATDDPGQLLMGMPGATAIQSPILGSIQEETGATFTQVPFDGGAGQQAAVLGSQVDAALEAIPAAVAPIEAGSVGALFVTTSERSPQLPDVPTMAELGWPLAITGSPYFLTLSAETPESIVDAWEELLHTTVTDPAVMDEFEELNFEMFWFDQAETRAILDDLAELTERYRAN